MYMATVSPSSSTVDILFILHWVTAQYVYIYMQKYLVNKFNITGYAFVVSHESISD